MIRRRPFWLPVRAASIQLEAAYPSLACWLEPGPALQLPLLALQLDRGRRMDPHISRTRVERRTLHVVPGAFAEALLLRRKYAVMEDAARARRRIGRACISPHEPSTRTDMKLTGTTGTFTRHNTSAPLLHDAARQRQAAQTCRRDAVAAPGRPGAVREAPHGHVAEALAPRGILVQLGLGGDVALPQNLVVSKEIEIRGSFRFHEEYGLAIDLLNKGLVDVRPLISATYPLASAVEAFEAFGVEGGGSLMADLATADARDLFALLNDDNITSFLDEVDGT